MQTDRQRAPRFLATETGTFIDFYHCFDHVMLSEKSAWFGARTREELYCKALATALGGPVKRWGEVQQLKLTNILFGGKLPAFLGFDRGPIAIRGGRATVHQNCVAMLMSLSASRSHSPSSNNPNARRACPASGRARP